MQSHILADRSAPPIRTDPVAHEPFGAPSPRSGEESAGGQIAAIVAENRELRAQVDQLHADRARWQEIQGRIMALLKTSAPEKLVHDLRNVLNERDLLKALVDEM